MVMMLIILFVLHVIPNAQVALDLHTHSAPDASMGTILMGPHVNSATQPVTSVSHPTNANSAERIIIYMKNTVRQCVRQDTGQIQII